MVADGLLGAQPCFEAASSAVPAATATVDPIDAAFDAVHGDLHGDLPAPHLDFDL